MSRRPRRTHTDHVELLLDLHAGDLGRPALGAEVRIIDEDGVEVPRGKVGEIIVRTGGMMLGYWNKPEET
ncbi:MAG: AMP-binding protein, partial [Streptosporangiales bacterium]|nr:AMP-binding protein [Streptosporangiales bacterium]